MSFNTNKYFFTNNKIRKTFFIAVSSLCLMFNSQLKADEYYPEEDYSYNIFTAQQWVLTPYVFAGYSFIWAPHSNAHNIEYKYMLRNMHHGFNVGVGLVINNYWSFGISLQRLTRSSGLRGGYIQQYSSIKDIDSEIILTNFDIGLKMPFGLFKKHLTFYVVGGVNLIVSSISHNFNENVEFIPVSLSNKINKIACGLNVGGLIKYNLTEGVAVRTEFRRMFIVSHNKPIKDSWLYSIAMELSF